jgi:hypothetical protein
MKREVANIKPVAKGFERCVECLYHEVPMETLAISLLGRRGIL